MTLTELLERVEKEGRIPASRYKDLKTSIRYLAQALGTESPDQCYEEAYLISEAQWKGGLDDYFSTLTKPPSPHTVRNTRNNLSYLFRQARKLAILQPLSTLPLAPLSRREHLKIAWRSSPYRERYPVQDMYRLTICDWPPNIRAAWEAYCAHRRLKVRQKTLDHREDALTLYLGFLHNIDKVHIEGWNDLLNVAFLDRFVRWHSARAKTRCTITAVQVAVTLRAIARHCEHPSVHALTKYCHDLPTPEPMHDKKHHWFTLQELEQVALSELESARKPYSSNNHHNRHPGLLRALQHQRALMLRLLIRIPLRQRCLREARLDRNLYQDQRKHWHLVFQGEELKVGTRNGRTNVFHIDLTDYCPDLLPHLEEFLSTYRLLLPNADQAHHLFLTRKGNPYTVTALCRELKDCVLRRTNKRFYPHLIRTLWATAFIAHTGDFTTAAYMINDTVQTVLKRYQEILEKDHQQKAHRFLRGALSELQPRGSIELNDDGRQLGPKG